MQRKFLGNLFLLQLLNWLIKPIWIFGIERMVQVNLGDEWYGKYFVIFNFGLLFNILLDFGLNSYVSSAVAKSGSMSFVKPILRLRGGLAGIYIFMVAILGIWQGFDPWILGLVILNQFLAGGVLFLRSILQGKHLFRTDSIVSVSDRAIAIVLCAIFIFNFQFAGRDGVLYFLIAQGAGYSFALFIAAFFAFRKTNHLEPIKPVNANISMLLKQTAWFAILALAMSVFTRIDALMIRNLSKGGYAEAGLYAQSFRLLDAALIFSSLISTMLLPVFSRLLEEKKNSDKMVWLNTRIVLFAAIPASLAAMYFGGDILKLLYRKSYGNQSEFLQAKEIFKPLMFCFIPMALIHIFGTWLTAAHKVKYLAILAFACMSVNVCLNFYWIPSLGGVGASYSCLITQSVFAFGCILIAFRLNAFKLHLARVLVILLWISLAVLVFAVANNLMAGIEGLLAACAGFILITFISGTFWLEIKKIFGF